MKKILAVLLVICCMLSAVSCSLFGKKDGDDGDKNDTSANLARFSEMLSVSVPTNSETTIVEEFNEIVLESNFSLVTGTLQNGKTAAVYQSTVQTLNDIENRQLNLIVERNETVWYVEGYGTSTNKGKTWNADGANFAPVAGSLSMNLEGQYVKSYQYSKDDATKMETLVVTVDANNASTVLANFLDAKQSINKDVTITIVAAADRISSITVQYVLDNDGKGIDVGTEDAPVVIDSITVTITSNYVYKTDTGDIPITFD